MRCVVIVPIYPTAHSAAGQFTVTGVVPTASGDPSKLKVKARVNIHGIFNIVTATLYEKLVEPAEAEGNGQEKEAEEMENQTSGQAPEAQEKPSDAGGGDAGTSRKEESQVDGEASMEADGKGEAGAPKEDGGETGPQQNAAAEGETQPTQDPPAKNGGDSSGDKKSVAKKKKTVKTIDLTVSACTSSASKEQLDRAREEEVCGLTMLFSIIIWYYILSSSSPSPID